MKQLFNCCSSNSTMFPMLLVHFLYKPVRDSRDHYITSSLQKTAELGSRRGSVDINLVGRWAVEQRYAIPPIRLIGDRYYAPIESRAVTDCGATSCTFGGRVSLNKQYSSLTVWPLWRGRLDRYVVNAAKTKHWLWKMSYKFPGVNRDLKLVP